jgi:hypothetical protein
MHNNRHDFTIGKEYHTKEAENKLIEDWFYYYYISFCSCLL